jgi:hypothetical protein
MSVVGIDFGALSTKIGVARNKGIDIVREPLFTSPAQSFSPTFTLSYFFRSDVLLVPA